MAKDTNRIIDETVGAFKKLKEEVKAYKDELASLKVGTDEWNKAAEKLRNAQKQIDAINKAAKGTLVDYNNAQQNSINYLKERIKLLNQERNAMDMNSKEYKEATAELKVLNDKLREAGTSAGDWKANVGNYASSIKDAFGELGTAANGLTGSIGGLNAGMLKLATSPVGAAIVAVTSAIKFLAEGIKSSEENTNRWNMVLVPIKTVLTMIQEAAQKAADKFLTFAENMEKSGKAGKVIETGMQIILTIFNQTYTRIKNMGEAIVSIYEHFKDYVDKMKEWANGLKDTFEPVIDFVDKVRDKIKEKLAPVIDWIIDKYNKLASTDLGKLLGLQTIEQLEDSWEKAGEITDKVIKKYEETEKKVRKLQEAENAYAKTKRGLLQQQAKLEGEIAEYARQYQDAREAKDWDAAQEALNKKKEKELELVRTNIALAATEANIIKQRNSLMQSSARDLDAEAAATAEVTRAKNAEAEVTAQLTKEQIKLNKERKADERQKRLEAYKKSVAALTQELNSYNQSYTDFVSNLQTPIKPEGGETTLQTLNEYYDQIKANAEAEYNAYADMVEAKISKLEEFIAVEKAAGNDTLAQETELAKLREEQAGGYARQYKKMIDTVTKSDKERAKSLKTLQNSELKGYADLFDGVSQLFEKNTVAYKATATAKALINTYLAATSALAETPGGAIAKGIAMAATLAAGLAQVIAIWKTDPKGEKSVPNASTAASPAVAEPAVIDSQPFTYTRTAQTFEEEEELNKPMWVSVTDINSVQNRVRVSEGESTW